MLTLRTLGGLSIEGPEGEAGAGGPQRRPLALLALLAAACDRGRDRNDLLVHLWPDSTPERARNVLKQTLYALRRGLQAPDLLLTEHDTLRLNPAVITSDVAEFQAAVKRRNLEYALEFYRGPFLDGFNLRESPEFERWRDGERRRLASDFARVAGSLAARASEANEHQRAAELWRRVLAADPLDPQAALGLMEALAAAGDRTGALQHARVHELLRREERGLEPDAAVAALADHLRVLSARRARTEPAASGWTRAGRATLPATGLPRWRSLAWWLPTFAVGLVLVLAGLFLYGRSHWVQTRLDPNLLVVAPYLVLDPDLQLWREGLVDVLSRYLDGAGPLRTVAPSVAINRWRGHPDPGTAAELGRRTGAGFAVIGSVLRTGQDSVRVTAAVVESASGRIVCEVERRDAILRMDRLTDSLTLVLLRDFERRRRTGVTPPAFLGAATTLEALKAYLRGEQFYRRGRWDSARGYYEHAVAHDSTFTLAVRRLGQVLGWQRLTVDSTSLVHLLRAGALNRGLAPRDSLLVAADSLLAAANLAASALAEWTHTRRLFAALQEAVRRYPDFPSAWLALGEAGYHFGTGPVVGVPEHEVLAAFDKAIALDSGFAGAYIHQVELGFNLGGRDLGLHYARRYLELDPQEPAHRGVALVLHLLETGASEQARRRMLDTAATEALVSARTILRRWPDSAETAVLLGRLLAQGRPSSYPLFSDTAFMRRRLAQQLAFRGHLREAVRVLGEREAPIFAELAYLGAIPDKAVSATFTRWIERDPEYARLALAWWSARGNTAAIESFQRQATRRARGDPDPDARLAAGYDTAAARAHLHLARGDTATALTLFIALPDTLCANCYLDRLTRGRLLARAGREREALAAFAEPLPAFLTPMEIVFALERAQVAEHLRLRREARRAYRFVVEAWARADPELGSPVREARAGLIRLGR